MEGFLQHGAIRGVVCSVIEFRCWCLGHPLSGVQPDGTYRLFLPHPKELSPANMNTPPGQKNQFSTTMILSLLLGLTTGVAVTLGVQAWQASMRSGFAENPSGKSDVGSAESILREASSISGAPTGSGVAPAQSQNAVLAPYPDAGPGAAGQTLPAATGSVATAPVSTVVPGSMSVSGVVSPATGLQPGRVTVYTVTTMPAGGVPEVGTVEYSETTSGYPVAVGRRAVDYSGPVSLPPQQVGRNGLLSNPPVDPPSTRGAAYGRAAQ